MKRRMGLALVLAVIGLAIVRYTPVPDPSAKAHDVQRLAGVVPLIDKIGLRAYRDDEEGCRSIEYRGGMFANDLAGSRCEFSAEDGLAFTDQAAADFERVRRSLADTGIGVYGMYVADAYEPDAGGNNRQIVFQLVERTPDSWAYVYEPGHLSLSDAPSGNYAEIDADWYFMAWQPGTQ